MKIVINRCYGGFDLSSAALTRYAEIAGAKPHRRVWDFDRTDPVLVRVVEELGVEANGYSSSLKVVEVPNGVDYDLVDYDGVEAIHEKHRVWF